MREIISVADLSYMYLSVGQWNEYSLLWGPGEVSRVERCPHFRGKRTLRKLSNYTEVSLFWGVL